MQKKIKTCHCQAACGIALALNCCSARERVNGGSATESKWHMYRMWGNIPVSCVHVVISEIQAQPNLVTTSLKVLNKLCHYKLMSL